MSLLKLNRLIQPYDYDYIVPFMAKLPLSWGCLIARVRGILQTLLDYDWRSNSLNLRYVRTRVIEFMAFLSSKLPLHGTFKRFMNCSIEEWQASLFGDEKKMRYINQQSHIDNIDGYKKLADKKKGVVLVSAHFDSFCMGIVLLGMNGLRVNAVSTAGMEDKRIALAVRNYFERKYRHMEHLMNGKIRYHETYMDFFHKRLSQGDIVVLMGDLPGSKSTLFIDFLGKKLRVPLGAWHMAKKTDSLLGAYVTLRLHGGKFHTICIPPYEPDPDDPVKSMMPIYTFLESWIKKHPEKWVASDLFQSY